MATKSSGYDVKAVHLTADTQALDADGISAAAAVGNNAALTIGGALASGGSCTFDAGRVVTILSAGDDSAISFTVVGTDVNGDAQTESVTGANAGTATGSNYFKTVTSITAVGDPAGNVSAGVNASAADVVFGWQISVSRHKPGVYWHRWCVEFSDDEPNWNKRLQGRNGGVSDCNQRFNHSRRGHGVFCWNLRAVHGVNFQHVDGVSCLAGAK
jgi:hypothetical protein